MKNKKNLIWLAVMAVLLGWTARTVFQSQTPSQLAQALGSADWRFLLLGLGLMAVFIGCEARSTHLILRAVGSPSPTAGATSTPAPGSFSATSPPPPPAGSPLRSTT